MATQAIAIAAKIVAVVMENSGDSEVWRLYAAGLCGVGSAPRKAAMHGKERNQFISELRGIAVLMVVLMHCTGWPVFASGYYGVPVFFAISGFLITHNILDRYGSLASIDILAFYRMRAARILPCLALLLALLSALCLMDVPGFTFPASSSLGDALWHVATFSFNKYQKAGAESPYPWAVLWSLSAEEAFYLLLPIASAIIRSEKLLVAGLVVVIANGLRTRTYFADILSYSGAFDLIDIGVLSAIAAHRIEPPAKLVRPLKWFGAGVAIGTYFFLPFAEHVTAGPSLIAFGAALMLFANKFETPKHSMLRQPIAFIGEASYEIYLFHVAIWVLLAPVLAAMFGASPNSPSELLAYLFVVIAFCEALRRSFSMPANRLIRGGYGFRTEIASV